MNEVWIVGREVGPSWSLEGIYATEAEANAQAVDDDFICLMPVGERLPQDPREMRKLYWPRRETWETSALYKSRVLAAALKP